MLFGLKNTYATYQRAMNAIFFEHIHKSIECYVDDIAVKSHDKSNHLADLRRVFGIMQAHQLKMNPTKSFMVCAELTNPVQSSETGSEDLAIFGKMIHNAIAYAKRCHACQIHGDFVHQAPRRLHPTSSSWPFETWGIDVIGPISPPTSKGHRFILAIMDYFSKQVIGR